MRITNDDKKPSLEEALEHYGVMGMKWGVRRDQAALDKASGRPNNSRSARAAVRNVGGTPNRGVGKKSTWNYMGSNKDVKNAREQVRKSNQKLMDAEDRLDSAKTSVEKAKAKKAFDKAESDFDTSHHRAIAAQMTAGEIGAIAILTTLATGNPLSGGVATIGAVGAAKANSDRIANRRSNTLEAEFMKGKTYKDVMKESAKVINKAAKEKK